MPRQVEIDAAAKIIRARCCRAADGRDITQGQSEEIATAVLRAAEAARSGFREPEKLGGMDF